LFAGKRRLYYGRWIYKYESAARQGAAGAIIIHTTESAGYPWQVVQSSWGGEQFELPAEGEPRIQVKGWATEAALRRLVESSGYELDKLVAAAKSRSFKPVPLGIRTSIAFTNKLSRVQTGNVAGLLPGSDPKLADQVVLFLFVAGEECGLLGSMYYALHPTFPAGKIAADINFDGGNVEVAGAAASRQVC
jgi:Zn-dependent M28 family amino/carboxypeptidase